MSHTVTVKVEYRNMNALRAAVEAMGGQWIGEGVHRLFQGPEQGVAFKLKGWRYPCVLRKDGTLAYDDYNGAWGDPEDLKKLQKRYAFEAAKQAAMEQGWQFEEAEDHLTIFHPDGGEIRVLGDGTVDTSCFIGMDCEAASAPIEAALGRRLEQVHKPEYYQQKNVNRIQGE